MTRLETHLWQSSPGVWMLKICGCIDREGFQHLVPHKIDLILKDLIERQALKLIVDLAAAEPFSSPCLQFLLTLHKQLVTRNIQIFLYQPNDHLRHVLRIMQIDYIFRIIPEDVFTEDETTLERILI